MSTWSIYATDTGRFTGQVVTIEPFDADKLAALVATGCASIEGEFDYLSQAVDLSTTTVVDWTPDAPSDTDLMTYAWDTGNRRWVGTLTLAGRQAQLKARVVNLMLEYEAGPTGQERALREVALAFINGTTPPSAAVTRLNDVDTAMAARRATVDSIEAATTDAELDAIEAGID